MTEPNEATTPLSRMRFSWQRGSGRPGTPTAPPELDEEEFERDASGQPTSSHVEESYERPSNDESPPVAEHVAPGQTLAPADVGTANGLHPPVEAPAAPPAPAEQQPTVPPTPAPSSAPARPEPVMRQTDRPIRPAAAPTKSKKGGKAAKGRKATFDVPPPGRRFSGGRGTHAGVRVALILTTCLLALGIVGYIAFSFGVATMRANTYRLSPQDVGRYNLTDFPLAQAGRFAADYARLCLTHSSTPGAAEQREAQLARFVSSGTDASCGWNGEGVQTVTDASWTGASEPITIQGYAGHARMMVVRVLTSAGSRVVTVPVYVADLASGEGMRIVGDIGEMPQPRLVPAPKPTAVPADDSALAEALTSGQFFQQFFAAWGASNSAALQRFVTPDASTTARAGLSGTLRQPQIAKAQVFFPSQADADNENFEWRTGMVAEAWVWVTWSNPAAGAKATEGRAYRLQLVMTTQAANPAQEWAVRDVSGGVPDLAGG
jgi:hypothetical protein